MKTLPVVLLSSLLASLLPATAAERDTRCFELRTYFAAPGKLDALNARFRNHTLKLFEKHGITNLGYWMPVENADSRLVYLLAFPSREARDAAFKAFGADPAWREVVKTTEADGRLVTKVESLFLTATDFSPTIRPSRAAAPRCFELRTYTAAPGKLEALEARFRNHTVSLFAKHGMTQFGYWTPMDKDKGADTTLVYLLVHQSQTAAAKSFQAFRADPDWIKAKADSETNGPLTSKVESAFLAPTDYSPTR